MNNDPISLILLIHIKTIYSELYQLEIHDRLNIDFYLCLANEENM